MNVTTTIGAALIVGLTFLLVMAIVKTGQDLMESEKETRSYFGERGAVQIPCKHVA